MEKLTQKKYEDHQKNSSHTIKKLLIETLIVILVFSTGYSYCNAMPREEYHNSDYCARCHVTEYNSWSETSHYNSSTSLEFQTLFEKQGSPESCLSCHTTGYKENKSTYIYENIQCESCHIPVREIEKSMYLTPCTNCHSSTQFPTHYNNEEYMVEHSHLSVDCTACHEPMGLKIQNTESNQCNNCHNSDSSIPIDEKHGFNYTCLDCHQVYRVIDASTANMTHFPIPQDIELECTMCHSTTLKAHKFGEEKCIKCHDEVDPALFIVDKSTSNETSRLCDRCHGGVYSEWVIGIHVGNQLNKTCIDCHNPHSPYVIVNVTLPPVNANEQCIIPQTSLKPIIPPTLVLFAVLCALIAVMYHFYPRESTD